MTEIIEANSNSDLKQITNQAANLSQVEMSNYFKEILKNKILVRDMFITNVDAYENKLKENESYYNEIQAEIEQERLSNEKDLKLKNNELKKIDEDLKKHLINLKLLSKTKEHYQILIKEKNSELHNAKQKSTFVYQDILNRKLQISSLNAQIQESEYQNNKLKSLVQSKKEELNLSRYDEKKYNYDKDKISIIDFNEDEVKNLDNKSLVYIPPINVANDENYNKQEKEKLDKNRNISTEMKGKNKDNNTKYPYISSYSQIDLISDGRIKNNKCLIF